MAEAQSLSRLNLNQMPGVRQALLLVGIAAAVALGVAVVLWSRSPSYSLLYSKLPGKDASAVVQALESSDIEYRMNNNTGAIMVPAAKVGDARLKLAAKGLPESGNLGMDIIGDKGGFGVSNFMEKARYQQLLEKDLARTIASLQSVKSSRVHLALPKESAFVRDRKAATASVLVDLYSGRNLAQSQVAAIVHLVASSVPALNAKQVTVVDQHGNLLTARGSGDMAISNRQFKLKRRIEKTDAKRIEQILIPLVGADKVHAQVVADMDFTRTESTSKHYDPDNVLRSEQTSRREQTGNTAAIGIPGALSNSPVTSTAVNNPSAQTDNQDDNAASRQQAGANASADDNRPREISTSATRNYELSQTISHTEKPVGVIRRLSVAVVIDNPSHVNARGDTVSEPLSEEHLTRLTGLVKDAVGFDAARGDTVSVVNAPFQSASASPGKLASPDWWQRPTVRDYIKQGLGVLIALALILFVLRPLLRSLVGPAAPATPQLSGPNEEEPDELGADQLSLSGGAPPPSTSAESAPSARQMNYEQKVGMAKRVASDDPRRVAQVVKNWVGEDG